MTTSATMDELLKAGNAAEAYQTGSEAVKGGEIDIQVHELIDAALSYGAVDDDAEGRLLRVANFDRMIALNPTDDPEVYLQADYFGGLHYAKATVLGDIGGYDGFDAAQLSDLIGSYGKAIAADADSAEWLQDELRDCLSQCIRYFENEDEPEHPVAIAAREAQNKVPSSESQQERYAAFAEIRTRLAAG